MRAYSCTDLWWTPQNAHVVFHLPIFAIGGICCVGMPAIPNSACARISPANAGGVLCTIRAHAQLEAAHRCHISTSTPKNGEAGLHADPIRATSALCSVVISGCEPIGILSVVPGTTGPTTTYVKCGVPSSDRVLIFHNSALDNGASKIFHLLLLMSILNPLCATVAVNSGRCAHMSCGFPPMHPLVHFNIDAPNNRDMIAAAEMCCFEMQHVCLLMHRLQRSWPHATHTTAAVTFVASCDMCGKQAHPIPAAAMVWWYSVAPDSSMFGYLSANAPDMFYSAVCAAPHVDPVWLAEACVVVGRFVKSGAFPITVPPYVIRVKSPFSASADIRRALLRAGESVSVRNASLFLYHLSLSQFARQVTVRVCRPTGAEQAYALLAPVLPRYANECTFAVTGDHFLHVCLRMHLPSWCTMLSPGGCYADMAALLDSSVNDIARPFVDMSVSEYIKTNEFHDDNVVLFVVACTLIAELAGSAALSVKMNRASLFVPPGVPCPTVLCDFPVDGVMVDAYGYMLDNTFYVCNGYGVDTAISMWIAALGDYAPIISSFVDGTADKSNPLHKYT